MRVRVSNKVVRTILGEGIDASWDALNSLLVIEDASGLDLRPVAKRAVQDAFVEVVRRYDLRIAWSGDKSPNWEKKIKRCVGVLKNEDGGGYTPLIHDEVIRAFFRGLSCEMSEEEIVAARLRDP